MFGFRSWWSAVALSDAAVNNHNMHNYSSSDAQQLQRYFGKFNLLAVRLLVCTNLFVPSHFWTTSTKFDVYCQRYIAKCTKN